MATYVFTPQAVAGRARVRFDTASGSNTPATISPLQSPAFTVPGAELVSDDAGNLPRFTSSSATLYQKTLNYSGTSVTATATLTGVAAPTGDGNDPRSGLDVAYAPLRRMTTGVKMAFLGDSTVLGGQNGVAGDATNNYLGDSWPTYLHLFSGGQIRHVLNAGVSGETSAQVLARVPTVIASGADTCIVLCGINDNTTNLGALTDVQLAATTATNLTSIVTQLLAGGIKPILCTLFPNNQSGDKPRVNLVNRHVRRIARDYVLTVIDFYGALVNPTNSNFATGRNADNTHPSYLGYRDAGLAAWNTLSPLLPTSGPWLVQDNVDSTAVFTNCVFLTDTNSDGVPDGWSATGDTTHYTIALVTDADFPGKAVSITSNASATGACGILAQPSLASLGSIGDVLHVSGAFKVSGIDSVSGSYLELRTTFIGASSAPADVRRIRLSSDLATKCAFSATQAIPAGTTALQILLQMKCTTAGAVAKFGQISVVNLTTKGLTA